MLKKYSAFFLIILTLSCLQKENFQFVQPEVFVSTAYLNNNGKSIQVNCETINPSAVNKEEFGICWSESPNPKITDNYQYSGNNSKEEGPFSEQILKFKPNTIYYIRGYMRIAGKDVYSDDFVYKASFPTGWNRLDDIPRDNDRQNLPIAYINKIGFPTFLRKWTDFETAVEYFFNENGNFWSEDRAYLPMYYEKFYADLEYGPDKFDFINGGGYFIENGVSRQKKYSKIASTSTFPVIENYPGGNVPSVGFGAGNKAFVIEVRKNPNMYAFNEDNYQWEQMKSPPFTDFTNIKASRAGRNGMVILENQFKSDYKMKVYGYDFEKDTWQQLTDFPGKDRTDGMMFSVKNKVYFGLGMQKTDEAGLKDIWEYDIITQKWTQLTDYPGTGSTHIAHVKKGNSIYLGMGYSSLVTPIGTSRKFIAYDFWKFTP